MRKEYDFSKADRGKFYRSGVKLNIPIYLEPDVQVFVRKIAESKHSDISTVVNEMLKSDMHFAEEMR